MTPDFIHAYFNWLLKTQTNTLNPQASFMLQAKFDESQAAGDIGDIRSLRISGKAAPQISIAPVQNDDGHQQVKISRKVTDKFVEFAQAFPVIEALLGKAKAESLRSSLGPDEYLSVDAAVKVRGQRTEKSKANLRNIANDIADMAVAKVRIEGKDGKVTDDDAILRTRMPFHLPHEGSNLLEFDNVADQLQIVYNRFVQDGKITA